MNFKMRKIGLIIFCSIFIAIGCVIIGKAIFFKSFFNFSSNDLDIFNLIPVVIGLFFIIIASTICIFSIKILNQLENKIIQIENKNFFWYKSSYPNCVNGTRVSCFQCGNSIVYTRTSSLAQNAALAQFREHYCSACGKTLYYSQSDL